MRNEEEVLLIEKIEIDLDSIQKLNEGYQKVQSLRIGELSDLLAAERIDNQRLVQLVHEGVGRENELLGEVAQATVGKQTAEEMVQEEREKGYNVKVLERRNKILEGVCDAQRAFIIKLEEKAASKSYVPDVVKMEVELSGMEDRIAMINSIVEQGWAVLAWESIEIRPYSIVFAFSVIPNEPWVARLKRIC